MTEPFNVAHGEFVIRGQLTLGYAVGVRTEAGDAIVLCATENERDAILALLPGKAFGLQRRQRCVLAGEEQCHQTRDEGGLAPPGLEH